MLERGECVTRFGVEQYEMALTEGPPLGVLSDESSGHALDSQRCECQGFGMRPIDRSVLFERLNATVQHSLEFAVDVKVFRDAEELVIQIC
jgi:hypothetical protein